MLLNLTNHPSNNWSEKQLNAALEKYNRIHDMPFPIINPFANAAEIDALVEKYLVDIQQLNPSAVHIMGEMTFTFRLIIRLKHLGFECITSTTERKVVEVDNQKVSTFEFVQFRKN
jgi:hypothetical protein